MDLFKRLFSRQGRVTSGATPSLSAEGGAKSANEVRLELPQIAFAYARLQAEADVETDESARRRPATSAR